MGSAAAHSKSETLLHVRGALLKPLAEGALWWAERQLLVVSDLHLEKGSSFAARGQMLPPYDTSATLSIVEALIGELAPQTVISLGDSFHDSKAERRMSGSCAARVRALTAATDWVWVEGNHDPDPPAHLGGRAAKVLRIGDLVFRHEPTGEAGEIAGHLHPCARIAGRHRGLRRRCFVTDGSCLVMPALGAFTGGLNVLDDAYTPLFQNGGMMVFAMGQDEVYPVRRQRLKPDGSRPQTSRWRMAPAGPVLEE
ncbi:MAG: ligase-associated DNA damage response endonuclease PdeM [Henriciella sp.]|nr:ligase-associated DNA damage response endonuclease PdeM [Henriciella sp.]